jgi:hypothetical protein
VCGVVRCPLTYDLCEKGHACGFTGKRKGVKGTRVAVVVVFFLFFLFILTRRLVLNTWSLTVVLAKQSKAMNYVFMRARGD